MPKKMVVRLEYVGESISLSINFMKGTGGYWGRDGPYVSMPMMSPMKKSVWLGGIDDHAEEALDWVSFEEWPKSGAFRK